MSVKWPSGVGRRVYAEIDSTNSEAARLAPETAGPEWLLGLHQTAARGRRGRAWSNPKGNFAATYLMHPTGPADQVALYSFVAALSLWDAFVAVTGRAEPFSLKWPNDVLLNGGKVAGILLESNGQAGQVSHLAIGIGVNLIDAPFPSEVEEQALNPVSLLSETGARVTPEEFLDVLAPAFADWDHRFATYGFAPIRDAWIARAAKLGEVITARTGTAEFSGTFQTVDERGALVLKTAKGVQAISAAEVFF